MKACSVALCVTVCMPIVYLMQREGAAGRFGMMLQLHLLEELAKTIAHLHMPRTPRARPMAGTLPKLFRGSHELTSYNCTRLEAVDMGVCGLEPKSPRAHCWFEDFR